MGIAEVLGSVGVKLPESVSGGGIGNFISALIFFIVFAFLVGGITYYISSRKKYNKKIHMFEEIAGQAVPVGIDTAKEIILPNTSIRAIYLRKKKVYLPRPSIQTGVGHYWYFIRKDGEWNNVGLQNLNKALDKLNLHYDHTDMRMSNASLKKLIEKNYKKLNWLKEYAPYIAIGILILILGISAFLVLNQANKNLAGMNFAAEKNAEVTAALQQILVSMDSICASSGIRSVG